jgi:hypothetical protein
MSAALQIPEIVSNVVAYLPDDGATLRSAMMISRTWAAECRRRIWSRPSLAALAKAPANRRPFFASLARVIWLTMEETSEAAEAVRDIAFPHLTELMLIPRVADGVAPLWDCPLLKKLYISISERSRAVVNAL